MSWIRSSSRFPKSTNGKASALRGNLFSDEQGKRCRACRNLSIVSASRDTNNVAEGLETYKGHDDDKRRKKKRKELMLLPNYEEKEFVPRDLTADVAAWFGSARKSLKKTFAGSDDRRWLLPCPAQLPAQCGKHGICSAVLHWPAPQVMEADGEHQK